MDESTTGKIRVLLIDAMVLFRVSLGDYLSSESGLEVAGQCGTFSEALDILHRDPAPAVDVVLLDFDLGTEHADGFIHIARSAGYRGRFLIVAGAVDARNSALALSLGASGVFLKSEPPERLVRAIRLVANGDVWVDHKVILLLADQVLNCSPRSEVQISGQRLSEREQKVLRAIVGGLPNRTIGSNIGISESSVKAVVQHLFKITGVRTRSQLVRMAMEGSFGTVSYWANSNSNPRPGEPIVDSPARAVGDPTNLLIAPGSIRADFPDVPCPVPSRLHE